MPDTLLESFPKDLLRQNPLETKISPQPFRLRAYLSQLHHVQVLHSYPRGNFFEEGFFLPFMRSNLRHSVLFSDDKRRDFRASRSGHAAVHSARVYGDFTANLDLCGGCRSSAGLGSVVERNPTSTRFQFAPLGGSSAIGLGNDSVDAGLNEALAAVIRAGARADIQVAGGNLDGVVGGSVPDRTCCRQCCRRCCRQAVL